MSAKIDPSASVFTLINVFDVAPEDQDELAELLVDVTESTMKHIPGFVSASIHVSDDGERVINYAQWESREHFERMLNNEDARPHMRRAAELAISYDPITCRVVDSLG